MKIDITKKYRTRDGREVKLFTTESRIPNMPVTGEARAQDGPWQSYGWSAAGLSFTARGNPYPQLDLIEVREQREWKATVIRESGVLFGYTATDEENEACEVIRVREILD